MPLKDLTGERYGRLTVIKLDEVKTNRKTGRTYWICQCDCGNEVSVRSDGLGKSSHSCGCLKLEQNKKNLGRFTTGESHSRLAAIWYHVRSRCYNEKDTNYKNYGMRGIKVYQPWYDDFLAFKKWAEETGYNDSLTIDRIDVNGNYTPENCRWETIQSQLNNKRDTLWVDYNGQKISLKQAHNLEKPDITYQTARMRYHKGIRNITQLFG